MGHRRILRTMLTVTAAGLLGLPAAAPAAEHPAERVGALEAGEHVFWDGEWVGEGVWHTFPVGDLGRASCDNSPCFTYTLDVLESGAELRVAIDVPERDDYFRVELTAPGGQQADVVNENRYNAELRWPDPQPGTWTILVRPYRAEDTAFRMRAQLAAEFHEPEPDEDGLLPPNLRMTPPFEFGFVAPANPGNGLWPPDHLNPPLEAAGIAPLSCAADEMAEEDARRCLRFSFGLENAGPGNFDIRYSSDSTPGSHSHVYQCVQRADGPPIRREAGHQEHHTTHMHDHLLDIVEHELLAVADPDTGELEAVGDGHKLGYNPADQHFADWDRFTQANRGTSGSAGNCAPGTDRRLGLSQGWGDVYRWQRPGNYVEFGASPDGEYVVRSTADPHDHILETTTADNTAYAHILVEGDAITVIEQGRGQDPWDPDKEVIEVRKGPDLDSSRPPPGS